MRTSAEGLVEPVRFLGHTVDSGVSLRLKGLDNGRLYREVASTYDLSFTKAGNSLVESSL